MAMLMMVVVVLIIMVVVMLILMMMVVMVMGMFGPGMRLLFHVQPQNGVHGRRAARDGDDRRRRVKLPLDRGAGTGKTGVRRFR